MIQDGIPIAVVASKDLAHVIVGDLTSSFLENREWVELPPPSWQIREITRKIDFTPEQIQAELSKRCAEIEKTHCNSFTEVDTKLFRRGNV